MRRLHRARTAPGQQQPHGTQARSSPLCVARPLSVTHSTLSVLSPKPSYAQRESPPCDRRQAGPSLGPTTHARGPGIWRHTSRASPPSPLPPPGVSQLARGRRQQEPRQALVTPPCPALVLHGWKGGRGGHHEQPAGGGRPLGVGGGSPRLAPASSPSAAAGSQWGAAMSGQGGEPPLLKQRLSKVLLDFSSQLASVKSGALAQVRAGSSSEGGHGEREGGRHPPLPVPWRTQRLWDALWEEEDRVQQVVAPS